MAGKLTARQLKAAERRAIAFDLRLKGYSFRDIAKQLGISVAAAYKTIQKCLENLEKTTEERARTLVLLENERLDQLHQGCWEAATGGDLYAIDRALKIMERRAKLFGLDAPNKVAQTNPDGTETAYDKMSDEELEACLKELEEKT